MLDLEPIVILIGFLTLINRPKANVRTYYNLPTVRL